MGVDIEATFDKAVYASGGIRVTDRSGRTPPFANADYLFESRHLIAELKVLKRDQVHEPRIVEKASRIYLDALKHGGTRIRIFGTCRLSADKFAEPYSSRLHELYRVPFQRVVRDAHTQIAETQQHFGLDDYRGLLLLANEGHTALEPWHVVELLKETFADNAFPCIHYTVFFTVNLKAAIGEIPNGSACWIPLVRPGIELMPTNFEKRLRKAWLAQLERAMGQPQSSLTLPSYDSIISARNLTTPSG